MYFTRTLPKGVPRCSQELPITSVWKRGDVSQPVFICCCMQESVALTLVELLNQQEGNVPDLWAWARDIGQDSCQDRTPDE